MGARGPKPKPTNLRVLHGDKKSRINKNEPIPSDAEVRIPGHLSDGATAVWDRLAPELVERGVLTTWDVDEFAAFCDAADRTERSRRTLDAQGEVTEQAVFDRNGKQTGYRVAQNPWFQIWKTSNELMQKFGARFGLSPSERSQIKVERPGNGKSAARLLS